MNISKRTLWLIFGGLLITIIVSSLVLGVWGGTTMMGYGMRGYGMMAYAGAAPMSGWQMGIMMTLAALRIVAIGAVLVAAAVVLVRQLNQHTS